MKLTLTIGFTRVTIPGAHITHLALQLHGYGFEAMVDFWSPSLYTSKDDLFSAFKGVDAITVKLAITAQYNMPDAPLDAIEVTGLCTRKWAEEIYYGQVSGTETHQRRYHIEFADIAAVLWPQHFPCVLVTGTTLKTLIDAQKPTGMTLSYDWDVVTASHPMLCLALDADHGDASFYDFVLWLVHTQNGVFTYNGSKNAYTLSGDKSVIVTGADIDPETVERIEIVIPETIRHNAAVLNAVAEGSSNQAIEQDQAITGVRRDMVIRTPLPADVDARVALETARLTTRSPMIDIEFNTYPTVTVLPGKGVAIDKDAFRQHTSWLSGNYRVASLSMRADKLDSAPGADLDLPHTGYQTQLSIRVEETGETHVQLPPFRRPRWPVLVEGKVLSTGGEDTDKTYEITQDQDTSLFSYKVNIPVWNKDVSALLEPIGQPGHFFFPAFKNQRVLVALYFQTASITRFLDFGARTQLTMDTQGNHILFGQKETSETSMRYAYEDGKSLFEVKRVMDSDRVTLQMKDGLLYLEVREEES